MSPPERPRLRTADKGRPPYPLNAFPAGFAARLAEEVVYLVATKPTPTVEGEEWERIFAACIGADWRPSNVGLDDIVLGSCAWGAKSVKERHPFAARRVRLISGRNSLSYSYSISNPTEVDPAELGAKVLAIWNERVAALYDKFRTLRTVVLLKGPGLAELAVFELETVRYDPARFVWRWNDNANLQGFECGQAVHRFTWQPHGSQFTIVEDVPPDRLAVSIEIGRLERLTKDGVLTRIGFSPEWIAVKPRREDE